MEIHFEIGNECLLKCRHCSSDAQVDGVGMQYSINEMIDFIKNVPGENVIFFTGGEPLLCNNYLNLLQRIKKEIPAIVFGMFTTGIVESSEGFTSVSEEYIDELCQSGMRICYFSVYSDNAEEHDWMTGQAGSYILTKASICRFIKKGVDVRFNVVVTKKNIKRIPEIVEMAAKCGVTEVRLLKLVRHGRAKQCWNEIGLEEEYRDFVKKMMMKKWDIRVTASSCPDITPCRPFPDAVGCQAGSKLLYITFEGEIYPCACVKNNRVYQLGDIKANVDEQKCLKEMGMVSDRGLCSLS